MEIRLLQYVLAVHECQNFTRAAERLHIAQPSLSQQIAKLEQGLGFRLFVRNSGPVLATHMGEYFVERARRILNLHDDLVLDLEERTHGMGDSLLIGTTAITGAHVLPDLLRAFQDRYPSVKPRLVEESTAMLAEWVAAGKLDLAILALPVDLEGIQVRTLLTEPLWLAVPAVVQPWMSPEVRRLVQAALQPQTRNPLMEAGTTCGAESPVDTAVSLSAIADAPFVLLKEGFGFRKTVLQLCAEEGFQPQVSFETSSIDTAQALVANGMGVTLVPQMVMSTASRCPLYVRLETQPTRTLVFAFPKDRHLKLAARLFMDQVESSHHERL